MHRKQVNFSTFIFMPQSCAKKSKLIVPPPREGPPTPQAESRRGRAVQQGFGLPTRRAHHVGSDKHTHLFWKVNSFLTSQTPNFGRVLVSETFKIPDIALP